MRPGAEYYCGSNWNGTGIRLRLGGTPRPTLPHNSLMGGANGPGEPSPDHGKPASSQRHPAQTAACDNANQLARLYRPVAECTTSLHQPSQSGRLSVRLLSMPADTGRTITYCSASSYNQTGRIQLLSWCLILSYPVSAQAAERGEAKLPTGMHHHVYEPSYLTRISHRSVRDVPSWAAT
jgi:hypothetical protein